MALTLRNRARVVHDSIGRDHEARLNAGMRDAISDATRQGHGMTRALTPVRTGYTQSTVDATVLGGGSHVSGHFGSDYIIFTYLEKGTRPHEIHGNPFLFWPGALHPVRKVNHPGTRPYGMLERAGPTAGEIAKDELEDVFRRVFG